MRRAFSPVVQQKSTLEDAWQRSSNSIFHEAFERFQSGCRQTNAARCWNFRWRYDNPRDRVLKPHGEDVSCGLKAQDINETAASLMPLQDRNRTPQPAGTQSLNEACSGNTSPARAIRGHRTGCDRNSDIAESHYLDTKCRSHQNDAH
jgi:hypothetical protein